MKYDSTSFERTEDTLEEAKRGVKNVSLNMCESVNE